LCFPKKKRKEEKPVGTPENLFALYDLAEIAIIAPDMTEVIGSAIAVLEVIIVLLVTTIFCCFMYLMHYSPINTQDLFQGFAPPLHWHHWRH